VNKTERLINLIAMLLEARRPVTLECIRASIPGYGQASTAAFKRMFERDKSDLREMGVPIRVEPVDVFGEEMGYRIPKEEYYLPEVEFTPEEKVALLLVNRLSTGEVTPLSREAQSALLKLSPDLGDGSRLGRPDSPGWKFTAPAEPVGHLTRLWEAVTTRRTVRFVYRSMSGEKAQERKLDPYGLYFDRGAWYVVGYCHLREEIRSFRVSRIESEVDFSEEEADAGGFTRPPDFRLADYSRILPWEFQEGDEYEARVRFTPRMAWLVERDLGDVYPFEPEKGGGGVLHATVRNVDGFLDWILSFAEDAEVLSPEFLREKVRSRLLQTLKKLEGDGRV